MAISDLLLQGVNLMLLGMGIVFTFLTILVVALSGMSRLAAAIGVPEQKPAAPSGCAGEDDAELVAVISAAINRFRNDK
jgi:oxaloacetate decarboxylase gamma subunit